MLVSAKCAGESFKVQAPFWKAGLSGSLSSKCKAASSVVKLSCRKPFSEKPLASKLRSSKLVAQKLLWSKLPVVKLPSSKLLF